MRLILHEKVVVDVAEIMAYYEAESSAQLASEFHSEVRRLMIEAAERPESFSMRHGTLRRVNLKRFPYHFLFRIVDDSVRILVVRHHRRHPSTGTERI